MIDEDIHGLARRALESQDPHQLVRTIDQCVRRALVEAAASAGPIPDRGPWRLEEQAYEIPAPRGYRTTDAGWLGQVTRLRGVIALDNEPLYDRIAIDPDRPGEHYFFVNVLGGSHDTRERQRNKTRVDTNQFVSGRLPEPERFEIRGVSLVVREDAAEEFVSWLRHETYFEIRVGGGSTPMDRVPSWVVTRKTRTSAVLEDELYTKAPILSYPPLTSIVIEAMETFQAAVIAAEGWRPKNEKTAKPEMVRCILHGFHGKGIRGR